MYGQITKSDAREEYKYIVPVTVFAHLLSDIKLFMCADKNCSKAGEFYEVSSIYFENISLRCYFDKLDGLAKRAKLRLRFYPLRHDKINLELKCKLFDKSIKKKTNISPDFLTALLEGNITKETKDPVLRQLMTVKSANGFFPFIQVDYKRKALQSPCDKNIRVTFDYDIRCCRYSHKPGYKPQLPVLLPGTVVMEIKTRGYFPFWLSAIVKKYSLKRTSISKYLLSVQSLAVNSSMCVK